MLKAVFIAGKRPRWLIPNPVKSGAEAFDDLAVCTRLSKQQCGNVTQPAVRVKPAAKVESDSTLQCPLRTAAFFRLYGILV